jgi:hypothetical protein
MNPAKRSGIPSRSRETLGREVRQRVCACRDWPKTASTAGPETGPETDPETAKDEERDDEEFS